MQEPRKLATHNDNRDMHDQETKRLKGEKTGWHWHDAKENPGHCKQADSLFLAGDNEVYVHFVLCFFFCLLLRQALLVFSTFLTARNGRRCCDYLRVNDWTGAAVSAQFGVGCFHPVVAIGRPDKRDSKHQGFAGGNSQNCHSKKQGKRDEEILEAFEIKPKADAAKEETAGGGYERVFDAVQGFQLVGYAPNR